MGVIRALFVKLGVVADTAGVENFEDKIGDVKKKMTEAAAVARQYRAELAQRFTLGVAAATAALVASTVQVAKNAREVSIFSEVLGVSTDELQRLQFAAESSGQDLQTLHDTMQTLGERAQDSIVDGPTSDAAEMLKRLGLDAKDAAGNLKDNTTLFFDLADALTRIENPTERAATAMTLLGDDGVRLLPILSKGADGLKEMGDEAARLGFIMDAEALEKTNQLHGQMVQLSAVTKGMRQALAIELIPQVLKLVEGFNQWIQSGDNAKKVTQALILAMKALAVAILLVAAAKARALFISMAQGITAAARATKALALALTRVNKRLLLMAVGAQALFILVIILQDIFVWLTGGESLIGDFINKFAESKGILGDVARWLIMIKPALADMLTQGTAFVKRVLPQMISALRDIGIFIADVASSILPALGKAFDDVKGNASGMINSIVNRILPALKVIGAAYIANVAPLIGKSGQLLKALFALVMVFVGAVVEIVAVLFDSFKDVASSLFGVAAALGGLVFAIVGQSVKLIIKIIQGLVGLIVRWVQAIAPIVKVLFGAVVSIIQALLPVIMGLARGVFAVIGAVVNKVLWAMGFAVDLMTTGTTEILPIVQGVVDFIVGGIAFLIEGITGGVTFVIDVITGIVSFITTIVNFVGDIFSGIADGFFAFWNGLVGFIAPIIGAVAGVIKAAFDIVLSIVRPIIKTILKAINLVRTLARKSKITLDLSGGPDIDIGAATRAAQARAETSVQQARGARRGARGDTDQSVKVQTLQVNVGSGPGASVTDIARQAREGVSKGLGDVQRRQAARDLAAG